MFKPSRLVAAVVLMLAAATSAFAQPPLWTVRDADSEIVLFGSVHVLRPGEDWRPAALDRALDQADDLWFEVDFDDAALLAASQEAIRLGLLPADETLTGLLNKKDQKRLARVAAQLNVPLDGLNRLQPWLAEITLSNAALSSWGARRALGVEQVLEHDVASSVPRKSFETVVQQIGILAGMSRKTQIANLSDTLKTIEKDPDGFSRIVALWLAGDTKGLDKEALSPIRRVSPELYRTLIVQRNKAWTTKITDRLAGSGHTVMVVGAGHLIGPDSVPAMLRAQGFFVEGPK